MRGRDPEFDKKGYRLPEIRTEIWQGWIYVTLDPDLPPVTELLAQMEPEVARYRLDRYIALAQIDSTWATNWKLLNENFMEGYHLPVAHRETVGAWFPVEETRFCEKVHDAFTWQTFEKDENAKYGRAHKDNHHLDGKWRHTSFMPTVFPSHMYVLAPDHMWYLSLHPRGVDAVDIRFGFAVAPEVHADLTRQQKLESWTAETLAFFDKVNAEDKFVVEGIHRGSASPLARPGPFSWLEREIHDFARYLDRQLNARPAKAGRKPTRAAAE